jgi:sugar (pentulose or hexulose) kinase
MPERIKNYCAETNQPIPETKGDIIRCVAQSLALKYRSTLESIEDVLGRPIKIINMVGGGIKDKMVCSFTANATGRTVKAGPVEATAAGNIIMQLFALGEINSLAQGREIVKRSFDFHEYTPQEGGKWDEAYQKYLKIIK